MHIKSIVSDEDREELERMLSLGFIIPNQLFKTRQKSRMIIYIFTPVEFLLSINCYLSESYLMFGIGIGTCVACVAWIIWYQMIGKNFEKNVHEFVWGRSGYETVDIDENAIKIDEDQIYEFKNIDRMFLYKNFFFFITNEKKIFIFKTTDMESDELIKIIILLEKSMYFKGNLVLQVPFLPSKTLMFYQMTLKIKRIMQGVTLLVIAVIFG